MENRTRRSHTDHLFWSMQKSQDQGLSPERTIPYPVQTYPVFAEMDNLACKLWEAALMLLVRRVANMR